MRIEEVYSQTEDVGIEKLMKKRINMWKNEEKQEIMGRMRKNKKMYVIAKFLYS